MRESEPGQPRVIKNGNIELRFQLRDEVSEELSKSICEHGVLVPPIVLELTDELKRKFRTEKPYVCIDGHSRLGELPEDFEVKCEVLSWSELVNETKEVASKIGMDVSAFTEEEIVKTYILRLHACREPLPKNAYIKVAEALKAKNLSLRQIASMLGIAKSTLHDWLKKEPIEDEDFEPFSQPSTRKQCGLCGEWIKRGAKRIWFHSHCHDKVVNILEKVKSEENEEACPASDDLSIKRGRR